MQVQGGQLFLPPPYFPMCQNGEKQQSPELATPLNEYSKRVQNLPPSKNGRVQNLPPLNSKFLTLPIFGGGKFWTLIISEGGQFRTLLFFFILAHREIRGWQEKRATLYNNNNIKTIVVVCFKA